MRRPTPKAAQAAHWRARLRGERVPLHEDEPQCGLYAIRFSSGELVPVRISLISPVNKNGELVGDEIMVAVISETMEIRKTHGLNRVWLDCAKRPISKEEYDRLLSATGRFAGSTIPARYHSADA